VYASLALFVSAGWWVAAVQLTPAADRPYVGGSQNNSELGLIFGYNGFGRITGNETGSVVAGGAASATSNPWGPTGITRLFNDSFGGQISWLVPGALVLLVGVLWLTRRAHRSDRTRAALVIFGGWMLVTATVFSFAKGIIHPYYTVALAPAIGGVVGVGGVAAWKRRDTILARVLLAVATAVTVVWSFCLLDRTPHWLPWLRFSVLVVGLTAAALIALGGKGRLNGSKAMAAGAVVAALASVAAGPLAYTLDTVATAHSGAIPTAGPTLAGAFGGPRAGGGAFPGGAGRAGRGFAGGAGRPFAGGVGGAPSGGPGSSGGPPGLPSGGQRPTGAGPGSRSGTGVGFLGSTTPGKQIVKLLEESAGSYTWVAATVGSNSAAGYQLATDDPVMAIGGFNGTDPAPTLTEFEKYVHDGKIHWFIATTGAGSGGTASDAAEITAWVEAHYSARTVDGVTLYDLSGR
jgi:4-amino-4-deoxy-L-arabinose transferase-like glycosyltransferase